MKRVFQKKLSKNKTAMVLAGVIMFNFAMPVNAEQYTEFSNADTEERGHYFLSEVIPTEITEYVRDYFTTFTFGELIDLGFTEEEINGLKLTPAITAYEYDECDSHYYYFPVTYNNEIIATLMAFEYEDGLYAVQFGKTKLASALNDLDGTSDDPYSVIITEEGYFAVNSTGVIETLQVFYPDLAERSNFEYTLEIPDVTFEEVKTANPHTVFINDSIGYSETVNTTKSARSVSQKYLSVPHVDNTYAGVCWAASSAAIIKFKINTQTSGEILRDNLVSTTRNYNGFAPGTTENTAHLLNNYISDATYDFYNDGWPSFTEIQSKINDEIPIYMNWQNYTDSAHATVLRGYYYNMSMPTNIPEAKKISMMDPNEDSYISITYGTSYSCCGTTYTLHGTVK